MSENVEAPKTTRWWFVLSQTLGELSQLPPGDPTVVTYTALCHLHNVTGHRNWSQDSEARDEPFQHILMAPGQLRFWTMDLGVPNSFSPLLKMSKGSFHIFSLGKKHWFTDAQALHGVDMRTAKQKREAGNQPPAEVWWVATAFSCFFLAFWGDPWLGWTR